MNVMCLCLQAMTERMHDVGIYKDMLKSQLKAAEAERQTHRSGRRRSALCH